MNNIRTIETKQDNHQLQQVANQIYQKYFHHQLHCTVTFDKTLNEDNLVGETFYSWYTDHQPHIFIYPYNARDFSNKMAISIIKHELIHYYLFKTKDKLGTDHNKHFHQIARKIGAKADEGRVMPWSLKFPSCRHAFRQNYHTPIYFYYVYPLGIHWEYTHLYYREHITDQYDKSRLTHYLGFLPMCALLPTMKHAKQIIKENSNLNTPQMVKKLSNYIQNLQNGKYKHYINKLYTKHLKDNRQQTSKKARKMNLAQRFANAINSKQRVKRVYKIVNQLYQKYFHHTLHCKMSFKIAYKAPNFRFKKSKAYLQIGLIGDNYDGSYDYTDAEYDLSKLKIALVHYYLWTTHNPTGYKHCKKFYQLVYKKFKIILQPKKKPVHIVQNPRKDFRDIYYSYPIGLWWSSNFFDEDHYVYLKPYPKPKKAYYLTGCGTDAYYHFYYPHLEKELQQCQEKHLNSQETVQNLKKKCKELDRKLFHTNF